MIWMTELLLRISANKCSSVASAIVCFIFLTLKEKASWLLITASYGTKGYILTLQLSGFF